MSEGIRSFKPKEHRDSAGVIVSSSYRHTCTIFSPKVGSHSIRQNLPSAADLNLTGRQFRKAKKKICAWHKNQQAVAAQAAEATKANETAA